MYERGASISLMVLPPGVPRRRSWSEARAPLIACVLVGWELQLLMRAGHVATFDLRSGVGGGQAVSFIQRPLSTLRRILVDPYSP